MARPPQDPQARINEILDAAELLFADKGYRGTTISAIAKKMGVAQGMLYYYFKSKEEILESLINRQTSSFISEIKDIACSDTIDPSRKMELAIHTLLQGVQYKSGLFLDFLHDDQQLHIKNKISRHHNHLLTPWLLKIIDEGNQKQYFRVSHPKTALPFILIIVELLFDTLYEKLPAELLTLRLRMAEALIEKALGAQDGTIHILI
ncbi:Nucleoid occlusion factor SlmA [bioreactor metagenome]|uniref:Nucleoid occlusion factor SlmA n=1 Tax=bioreactor metagenome TaxID=1076179 RepID=A0A644TRR0_9ZZZZ|nr:TetR/AcrR family transcriptional regulator [Negativicutes bacterium]